MVILPARIVFSPWLSLLFLPFSSLWLWLAPDIQPGSIYHTWKCESVREPDCIMHFGGIFLQLAGMIAGFLFWSCHFFFPLSFSSLKWQNGTAGVTITAAKAGRVKIHVSFLPRYFGFIRYLSEKRIKGRLVLALSPDCRFIKSQLSLCQYLEE